MSNNHESTDAVNGDNDPWLNRQELCAQLKIGRKTLARLELRGEGPAFVQLTSSLRRYRQSTANEWLAARMQTGPRPAGKTPTQAIAARWRG